ncbi:hypothetical protein [Halorubrum tebenquichense]|uniref:Uncharacterized protein n=1 Tax=Halorubrum tebenquichense DSM 14210 TaxID=1227485 RepID=M0DMH0_9EURY|nr:hypothetical protein [Halorubrum tebenquichense]ELZ35354.1 hypothetical protein C472_12490 [Halorubrum tebenquichense DSM 14210]
MPEEEVSVEEALAVAQRALAKTVGIEEDISDLKDETAELRSRLDEVERRLSKQEALADEEGGDDV